MVQLSMQRWDPGCSCQNHQSLAVGRQKGSELRARARMNGLSNGCEPLLDSRFVRYRQDVCSNPITNGDRHSTRPEETAKTFHDQIRKPEFGNAREIGHCRSTLPTGNSEEPQSTSLRLRHQNAQCMNENVEAAFSEILKRRREIAILNRLQWQSGLRCECA
jgi:hypothetical protein